MQQKSKPKIYLQSDGQSQKQRFSPALDPRFAKIDDRSLEDLLNSAARYAKLLNFFDLSTGKPAGDWSPLFEFAPNAPREIITKLEGFGSHEPHLALYLTFLLLFQHAQNSINSLTGKHLDFYYRDILRFSPKGPVPDRVHVLFELKKNIRENTVRLEQGRVLKAGKDTTGADLLYALTDEIFVNKARVESLKAVFVEQGDKEAVIRCAPQADSSDGVGGELDQQEPKWQPFGNNRLPVAEIGFALASPVLSLKEGTRTITVSLTLASALSGSGIPASTATGTPGPYPFPVYLTGEKGWISASSAGNTISGNQLKFIVKLEKDQGAVVSYDPAIHGSNFETCSPVMQVILNMKETSAGYFFLKDAVLKAARIEVTADEIRGLSIENDLGRIDPARPFMPFGPEPGAGSNLSIGSEEAFTKNLKSFSFKIEWQNVPAASLASYYSDYSDYRPLSDADYFQAKLSAQDGTSWKGEYSRNLFYETGYSWNAKNKSLTNTIRVVKEASPPALPSFLKDPGYKISRLSLHSSRWAHREIERTLLISKIAGSAPARIAVRQGLKGTPAPQPPEAADGLKRGTISLQLNNSFLHKEYRKLYATKIIEAARAEDPASVSLPNEPYTPVIQSLTLSYTATTGTVDMTSANEDDFLDGELEFFHITVFGQNREHRFLSEQLDFVADKNVYLLPQYRNEGELYIGISSFEAGQNLAVLFQVAEGSAHPEKRVKVTWSILSDNHWKDLEDIHLISDATNGLLTSGIIKFAMPKEATGTNTILPAGYHWLRASVSKDTDAVCQLIEVRTNAALAQFRDSNANDPENLHLHLLKPLAPGSIKKLAEEAAAIKSIEQPFSSFGGRRKEDDTSLSTRASERLRHKNRAVSIWDFERMVLQEFPSVYKVKCLSHTCPRSWFAPGHVTVVVIPDLKNKNAVDPLQPKVDANTLDRIGEFLEQHAGYFVRLHVENPVYEELMVDCRVSFHQGFESNYYRDVLRQDITRFLSPWAFEEEREIAFGGRVHKSVILDFIEKRPYVDYITDVKLYHLGSDTNAGRDISAGRVTNAGSDTNSASASNPKAILVSVPAREHRIESV